MIVTVVTIVAVVLVRGQDTRGGHARFVGAGEDVDEGSGPSGSPVPGERHRFDNDSPTPRATQRVHPASQPLSRPYGNGRGHTSVSMVGGFHRCSAGGLRSGRC